MKPLRANPILSARGDRIARAWALPSCPPPGEQERAAPVVHPHATGAGVPFEPCAVVGSLAQETAPAENPERSPSAGAVILSEHALILLRAVAAYEQVDNAAAITLALATHCKRIGAGPLARAVLDEIGRTGARRHTPERATAGGEGNPALPAGLLDGGDLHAVPEFRRIGENRFRGGGP